MRAAPSSSPAPPTPASMPGRAGSGGHRRRARARAHSAQFPGAAEDARGAPGAGAPRAAGGGGSLRPERPALLPRRTPERTTPGFWPGARPPPPTPPPRSSSPATATPAGAVTQIPPGLPPISDFGPPPPPKKNPAMKINGQVAKILANYESDNPGTKANLARILMHGKLGGTGKMVILPVDQGFEHGPARSFAPNPAGLRPALPLPAGDRRRAERLCRAARVYRRPAPAPSPGRSRPSSRCNSANSLARQGKRQPGGHRQRQRRAAARLLGDRLHDLSRLRRRLRHDGGNRRDGPRRPSRSASPW